MRFNEFVSVSRDTVESQIWEKPPIYFKVWMYLLIRASQWKEYGFKKGQLYTSISEIQDACGWKIGYRTKRPSKTDVIRVLNWLRDLECEHHRIKTEWK
ncbi:hypothetical protein SAMN05444392_11669 [Seinonella peptonophila]|uniref:Uncharacterized protein n=1 Tax=Seinonella peptonophila TaxID=112248 RepID=A0A1M5AY94_9BACL|nr:hypothetical protein [Seinonella peptonophila]SHF35126.1 hypothetical protein SAMN05444392_11669 [Seinonella peptonophila]